MSKSSSAGLIADVGGTHARFAVADTDGYHDIAVLSCADYPTITAAIESYLRQIGYRPRRAVMAIAGPVGGDRFAAVNMPWTFSRHAVQQELRLDQLEIMNDFKAIALAVPHLAASDLRQVGEGAPVAQAPIGIIGPGTGLGVAALIWNGADYMPIAGEGGHVTMPPLNRRDLDLFNVLHGKYRHISAERVCSGKGLVNLYHAIGTLDGHHNLPDRDAAAISAAGITGSCPVCREALELMLTYLGIVAGNLALTLGAHGGIYLAGGIIAKLGEYFYTSKFRQSFVDKGRLSDYLNPIPTYVVLHPYPAFVGLHATVTKT